MKQSARFGACSPAYMSTVLAHPLLQHQDQLYCIANAGKMQGPHSQELQLVGWGGEHLFLTHTTKWQQVRAGPDLPSSCSPAAHPHPVDRVSSTVLFGGGAGSTFPSAAADKGEGQFPCLEQVAWEGGASFLHSHQQGSGNGDTGICPTLTPSGPAHPHP